MFLSDPVNARAVIKASDHFLPSSFRGVTPENRERKNTFRRGSIHKHATHAQKSSNIQAVLRQATKKTVAETSSQQTKIASLPALLSSLQIQAPSLCSPKSKQTHTLGDAAAHAHSTGHAQHHATRHTEYGTLHPTADLSHPTMAQSIVFPFTSQSPFYQRAETPRCPIERAEQACRNQKTPTHNNSAPSEQSLALAMNQLSLQT